MAFSACQATLEQTVLLELLPRSEIGVFVQVTPPPLTPPLDNLHNEFQSGDSGMLTFGETDA